MADQSTLDTRALEVASEARALIERHMDACDKREVKRERDDRDFRDSIKGDFGEVKQSIRTLHKRIDDVIGWRTKGLVSAIGILLTAVGVLFFKLMGLG